ncbi:hypothetical protein Tco_0971115 [Tanacetum coccineum]
MYLYLLIRRMLFDAFKPAFRSFFGEEHQTFKLKMFHNLDQLRLQLERENLHGVNAKTCLQASDPQFKEFLASKGINPVQAWMDSLLYSNRQSLTSVENINCIQQIRDCNSDAKAVEYVICVKQLMLGWLSQKASSGTKPDKQNTSSSSGSYTTQAVDADIGPVHDDEPFAEVQLTALHNILDNEQQHTEQSEPNYDTHLLETIDSNTTPTSTNLCHRGG